jgi:hypothetical protein
MTLNSGIKVTSNLTSSFEEMTIIVNSLILEIVSSSAIFWRLSLHIWKLSSVITISTSGLFLKWFYALETILLRSSSVRSFAA